MLGACFSSVKELEKFLLWNAEMHSLLLSIIYLSKKLPFRELKQKNNRKSVGFVYFHKKELEMMLQMIFNTFHVHF